MDPLEGDATRSGATNFGPINQPVELWHSDTSGSCGPVPAVAGDTVYLACEDGTLYVFARAKGDIRWTFTAEPFGDGPTIAGGLAYVMGEDSLSLYAVDIATGEERWRYDAASVIAAPAVAGGMALVNTAEGFLIGLDAATGEERWRTTITTGGKTSNPALLDGMAYVGSDSGNLAAVDAATGEIAWQVDTGDNPNGAAVVADGIVYVGAGSLTSSNSLSAYDAETGALRWQRDEPMLTPSVANGVGYSGSLDGTVYAFDTASGEELWRVQVGEYANPVAIAGDIIYVPSEGARAVYALDAATGDELWNIPLDNQVNTGPIVSDGVAYLGTTGGILYAIAGSESGLTRHAAGVATPAATPEASPATSLDASVTSLLWRSGPEAGLSDLLLDVAIAPAGNIVYVIDAGHNDIAMFSPDGEFLGTWGAAGSGPGEFLVDTPSNGGGQIDFDAEGNIYVFDTMNHRIQKFAPDRTFIKEWGGFGSGEGQFNMPTLGAVDRENQLVYVPDNQNNRIQVFDLDGNFLDMWGEFGSEPGQLSGPSAIALASDGTLYISEETNLRIQHFTADGEYLGQLGQPDDGPFNASDLAVDASGNLWVTTVRPRGIRVYDPTGTLLTTFDTVPVAGYLDTPISLAFDQEGNLYIVTVDGHYGSAYLVSPDGQNRLLKIDLSPEPGATPVATPAT